MSRAASFGRARPARDSAPAARRPRWRRAAAADRRSERMNAVNELFAADSRARPRSVTPPQVLVAKGVTAGTAQRALTRDLNREVGPAPGKIQPHACTTPRAISPLDAIHAPPVSALPHGVSGAHLPMCRSGKIRLKTAAIIRASCAPHRLHGRSSAGLPLPWSWLPPRPARESERHQPTCGSRRASSSSSTRH